METFLNSVAQDFLKKHENDLEECVLIFPNKRSIAYFKKELGSVIGKPFWSPTFYTVQDFFSLSCSYPAADELTQFFMLLEQYNKLLAQENKKFLNPDTFYSNGKIILHDFLEIDRNLIDPGKIFGQLEDIARIQDEFQELTPEQQDFLANFWKSYSESKQKSMNREFIDMWTRMPILYENFHKALQNEGLTTIGYIYRKLAEGKADKMDFSDKYTNSRIVCIGFNDMTIAEENIFKNWQDQQKAIFYFDWDDYYLNDELQEAGFYARRIMRTLGLKNELRGKVQSNFEREDQIIRVFECQGNTQEAKILFEQLKPLYSLLNKQDNSGEIAIIMADETLLLPLMETIPEKDLASDSRIPLNITMGFPLLASELNGLISLWFRIQKRFLTEGAEFLHYKDAEDFLSMPLSYSDEKEKRRIFHLLSTHQQTEIATQELITNELSRLFLQMPTNSLMAIEAMQNILQWILRYKFKNQTLKELESGLLMSAIKELNRLSDTLHKYTGTINTAFTIGLMEKMLQQISVPLNGEPLQGIQIMGLLESRNLDFKNIFILGANEDVLPNTTRLQSFIPENIKKSFGLPVTEQRNAATAYILYRLLQRSQNVSFFYNGITNNRNNGEYSRYLRQLEYESKFDIQHYRIKQELSVLKGKTIEIPKNEKIYAKLLTLLNNTKNPLSASAFTTYMNCPLSFFFKYIAEIKEPEEIKEELEANQIGEAVHRTMQRFYEKIMSSHEEISLSAIEENEKNLDDISLQALKETLYPEQPGIPLSGIQLIALSIIREYCLKILKWDKAYSPFQIIELENDKDYIIPFSIRVDKEDSVVYLKGIIDRVDLKNGKYRIVDYKTGGDELRYRSLSSMFDEENTPVNKALLQTLFYTHIYEEKTHSKYVEPNLFVLRKMETEGTLFTCYENRKKIFLSGDYLEETKKNFIEYLRATLEDLFSPAGAFVQTPIEANCLYCIYRTLCRKS